METEAADLPEEEEERGAALVPPVEDERGPEGFTAGRDAALVPPWREGVVTPDLLAAGAWRPEEPTFPEGVRVVVLFPEGETAVPLWVVVLCCVAAGRAFLCCVAAGVRAALVSPSTAAFLRAALLLSLVVPEPTAVRSLLRAEVLRSLLFPVTAALLSLVADLVPWVRPLAWRPPRSPACRRAAWASPLCLSSGRE